MQYNFISPKLFQQMIQILLLLILKSDNGETIILNMYNLKFFVIEEIIIAQANY